MPRAAKFALGLVLLAAIIVPSAAQDNSSPLSWLIVLQGEVTEISDTELSLRADPQIVAFTDRPNRLARLTNIPTILNAWGAGGSFKANPPNASVVNETEGEIAVIEITDLSGDDLRLTATINRLEGELPMVGNRVAITIDGGAVGNNDPLGGDD